MSKKLEYDPNDEDRQSDIMTLDGEAIENSTPEGLEEERRRNSKQEKNSGCK